MISYQTVNEILKNRISTLNINVVAAVTKDLNNILTIQESLAVYKAAREELDKNYRDMVAEIDSRIAKLRDSCPHLDRGGGCICSVCGTP